MYNQEHSAILELLPAYALGSLDDDEAEQVGRHLSSCAICQAELREYEAVAGAIPLAVTQIDPSPELRNRLMRSQQVQEQIGRSPPAGEPVDAAGERAAQTPGVQQDAWWQTARRGVRNWFRGSAWRPVLALIILALVASNILLWQGTRSGGGNPSWRRVALTGSDAVPDARGIIYISPDGQNGTLIVNGLPALGEEQQYQLWLILDGQRDSGAVFSVNLDGYRGQQIEAPRPLRDYGAFGVTIEPAGGSPGPTGQRVLASDP
jgi:anti-sigma-K factor RskA